MFSRLLSDARDDSKNGRIKTDLAGGFEVLKASTRCRSSPTLSILNHFLPGPGESSGVHGGW